MPDPFDLLDAARVLLAYAGPRCPPSTVAALCTLVSRLADEADQQGRPAPANLPHPPGAGLTAP